MRKRRGRRMVRRNALFREMSDDSVADFLCFHYSHFLPFISRGLSSVIQSEDAVVHRQWSLGSFSCSKHQQCRERDDGRPTVTTSTADPSSPPPNPNSTHVPATTPNSVSNSVTNNLPVPPSTTSPCALSSPAPQIHLLWLLVPPSLLSLCELLLGTGSKSPAFCAPASLPLRHYHSQRQQRASAMHLVPATRVCRLGEQLQVEEADFFINSKTNATYVNMNLLCAGPC